VQKSAQGDEVRSGVDEKSGDCSGPVEPENTKAGKEKATRADKLKEGRGEARSSYDIEERLAPIRKRERGRRGGWSHDV